MPEFNRSNVDGKPGTLSAVKPHGITKALKCDIATSLAHPIQTVGVTDIACEGILGHSSALHHVDVRFFGHASIVRAKFLNLQGQSSDNILNA